MFHGWCRLSFQLLGDVRRKTTHQATVGQLRKSGRGWPTRIQHIGDNAGILRPGADPDSRPGREEPSSNDERLESIR